RRSSWSGFIAAIPPAARIRPRRPWTGPSARALRCVATRARASPLSTAGSAKADRSSARAPPASRANAGRSSPVLARLPRRAPPRSETLLRRRLVTDRGLLFGRRQARPIDARQPVGRDARSGDEVPRDLARSVREIVGLAGRGDETVDEQEGLVRDAE